MRYLLKAHSDFWGTRGAVLSTLIKLSLLIASFLVTYYAKQYTSEYQYHIAPDIILDHLPVVSVGYLFFQCAFIFGIAVCLLLLSIPEYLPFTLGASALFFFVRSIFMTMTHLSAPVIIHYSYVEYEHHTQDVLFSLSSGNDLFFSGHAGYPFLLALIFWKYAYVRYIFLLCSAIGALTVLFGHLHYSIDVFSAYFIAFGVFTIAQSLFKKDWSRIQSSKEPVQ